MNVLKLTDTYSAGHEEMKINTDWETSYIYNRGEPTILFGFSKIVKEIFGKPITREDVDEVEKHLKEEVGVWFSREKFDRIVNEFDGYFPVMVRALPDGSYLPRGTPFCEISNTAEGFGECVSWWESRLLKCWWDCSAAMRAYEIKKYLKENNLPLNLVHNFAFRSYPSDELGMRADRAWSFFLPGSDGFAVAGENGLRVNSIPASAHKVVQQFDKELDAYLRAIDAAREYGMGIVAIPIDTYDTQNFINNIWHLVETFARFSNVKVAYRVDSGNVLDYALQLLKKKSIVIISEGLTFEKIKDYVERFKTSGIEINGLLYFGIGSGWWKDFSRDKVGMAMKTAFSNGKPRMKFSNDPLKRSLPGKLDLVRIWPNEMKVFTGGKPSLYETIYEKRLNQIPTFRLYSLDEVRRNFENSTSKQQKEILIDQQIEDLIVGLSPKKVLQEKTLSTER